MAVRKTHWRIHVRVHIEAFTVSEISPVGVAEETGIVPQVMSREFVTDTYDCLEVHLIPGGAMQVVGIVGWNDAERGEDASWPANAVTFGPGAWLYAEEVYVDA